METNWITLTADDLNDYQVAKIITAARTKALAAGQADPFVAVMPDIVARIRAEVRGCARNRVSNSALTIPPDLKAQAIYLIIEAMQPRLPGLALSEDHKTLIKDAREYLKRVSRCEIPIGEPSDPEITNDVQSTAGTPRITPPVRKFDRQQDGI
jgi:hypothetical protein